MNNGELYANVKYFAGQGDSLCQRVMNYIEWTMLQSNQIDSRNIHATTLAHYETKQEPTCIQDELRQHYQ